jgi:hypothetical protein
LSGIGTAFAKCKTVGNKCNHDHQCCSGTCQNGMCAAGLSCVTLSNGTCATPCSKASDCATCVLEPMCTEATSGAFYCGGADTGFNCQSDSDCSSGQFCRRIRNQDGVTILTVCEDVCGAS